MGLGCMPFIRTEQPDSVAQCVHRMRINRPAAPGPADPSFHEARPSRSQTQSKTKESADRVSK
jgi:hypothetical protein